MDTGFTTRKTLATLFFIFSNHNSYFFTSLENNLGILLWVNFTNNTMALSQVQINAIDSTVEGIRDLLVVAATTANIEYNNVNIDAGEQALIFAYNSEFSTFLTSLNAVINGLKS